MGVAPHDFLVDAAHDVVDGEAAVLGPDLCVEDHLKEKVAQLFHEFVFRASFDGFDDLVGFFDQIGPQGFVGLFPIPRAPPLGAELGHDVDKFLEGPGLRHDYVFSLSKFCCYFDIVYSSNSLYWLLGHPQNERPNLLTATIFCINCEKNINIWYFLLDHRMNGCYHDDILIESAEMHLLGLPSSGCS